MAGFSICRISWGLPLGLMSSKINRSYLNPMGYAPLNWASIFGILLGVYAIPASVFSLLQLFFSINRRADTSPAVIIKLVSNLIQSLGRLSLLLIGVILFLQGWRLDPILQFAVSLLAIGIVVESAASVVSDYQKWRQRLGRAKTVIAVSEQPSDQSPS